MNPLLIGTLAVGAAIGLGGKLSENETKDNDFYKWDTLIREESNKRAVPFNWTKAIMMIESDLGRAKSVAWGLKNPADIEKSKSSDGKSWGLMQLTLPTARMFESVVTVEALNNPEISVRLGTKYLQWLISKKGLNQENVIRSYNGGAGWKNSIVGVTMTKIYYEKFLNALEKIKDK